MKMKITKQNLVIAAISIIAFSMFAFKPLESTNDTIMIRSTQVFSGSNKSFIRVYKGNNQLEKIALDKYKWTEEEKTFDLIISTVKKFEDEGYEVISHSELMYGGNGFINTFIMTKK